MAALDVDVVNQRNDDHGGYLTTVTYEKTNADNGNWRENVLPRQPVGAAAENGALGDAPSDDGEGDADCQTHVPVQNVTITQ